jgi:iron(III) transport system substrate-binding protein
LKQRGALASYTPVAADTPLRAFKALAESGDYYAARATSHALISNGLKVLAAEAWTDLPDPQWKGRVATGHPAFSGCTAIRVLALRKAYGWEYFGTLAKNNPRIGRSGNDPVTLITAREGLVTPAPASRSTRAIRSSPPTLRMARRSAPVRPPRWNPLRTRTRRVCSWNGC